MVANEPLIREYVSQIERMCQQLKQGKAEELWGEIKIYPKEHPAPQTQYNQRGSQSYSGTKERQRENHTDCQQRVSMVVMDKEEYIKKSKKLLKQPSYKELTTDPTNKIKNRLINLLKIIQAEGGINNITYKRLYPHRGRIPQILWATQNTQSRCTIKACNFQQGFSHIWNSQRAC